MGVRMSDRRKPPLAAGALYILRCAAAALVFAIVAPGWPPAYALSEIQQEEAGARDILAEAFEEQKKYEQVAENMRLAAARERARREGAVLDELGLRAAAGR